MEGVFSFVCTFVDMKFGGGYLGKMGMGDRTVKVSPSIYHHVV